MAASCSRAASKKELEDELTAYGKKLMSLCLEAMVVCQLGQCPSDLTRIALQPVMKALIGNELLRHTNEDVKVSVISCITEISRKTAPQHPYEDDRQMKIASPVSSKMGEKVLQDCAAIVKPYLAESLKSMSLNPDDCAEIVASICNEIPKGEEMMANENAPDTVRPVKVGPSEAKFGEPVLQDETHREKLKDTCRTNIMIPDNPEDVQPATNAEVVSRSNKLRGSSGQHSSASKKHDISNGRHGHWGQPKKKESTTNEDAHLCVKKKDSLHLGLAWGERTKHTLCAKRKPGRDSRENESASNSDAERKSEFSIKIEEVNIKEHKEQSLQQIDGMKQQNNKITNKMHSIEESGDKHCGSNFFIHDSKRPRTIKYYGEELLGARIKVWWPLDAVFYEATISSFDPVQKRHKVAYVDGDVEKLSLHKERREMLEDNSSQKDHGTDFQGQAVSSST
ncbi:hypothetical protein RND71_006156 [Anisodus tanguticus]|uniref:Tudor domain-containing protein n=1 Tax=Anisodus tanguticus TaxID=243964 RepID=A0AAE1SRF4_9SOLA|nr:hypothetical protein RND71_006156 [Anisodus tanguticus]